MIIQSLQIRLQELGYYSGKLDNQRGGLTDTAIIEFKRNNGLRPRSTLGPMTMKALYSDKAVPKVQRTLVSASPNSRRPLWYQQAVDLAGTREIPGDENNPVILDWADNLDLDYSQDDTPWCGLFIAHCLKQVLVTDALPENPLGAREWLKYGQESEPQLGAILVFWRESKSSWKGHVGFYAGEDAAAYHVLGGNQSNAVCVTRIAKSRLLGARWPSSVAMPTRPLKVARTATGLLSSDEA